MKYRDLFVFVIGFVLGGVVAVVVMSQPVGAQPMSTGVGITGTLTVGQARPPLTISQALSMLAALRALDGRQVVVKQGAVETVIVIPYEFNSGVLRLRIARNISTLTVVEKLADETRTAILREIEGQPPVKIQPGSPEMEKFIRLWSDALEERAKGSDELARIKAADLRLDKNEIPVTVLSALVPILDE